MVIRTTVLVSNEDKERIERMRRMRQNPKKWQNKREAAGDVIHRALDALEREKKC